MALLLLCGAPMLGGPPDGGPSEYEVKAAFLLNFARFVEWPPSSYEDAEAPVRICVLGDDPFGMLLDETLADQNIGGRPVAAVRSTDAETLTRCHVLFVAASEADRVVDVLEAFEGTYALTVSEVRDFARLGGAFNFFLERGRVRFEVNPEAARRHGLRVSSELLRLGRPVQTRTATRGAR